MRNKQHYTVWMLLFLMTFLAGCCQQPVESTDSTLSPATEAVHATAEPLIADTEFVQVTELPTTEPSITEQPVTESHVAELPATEPPSAEPSTTELPATEPPAKEPPATEPPATEPPATEPPVTEPPATEPPTTEPPVTEPPVTEPPTTEPPATEPPATEPPATEPPATEAPATEPEPTESETVIILDYAAAMAYGNQYAVETYGYYIDLTLCADNAGFEFPYNASVHGIMKNGGQEYLHLRIARKVDSLAESLSARGISKAYISCCIYEDADGIVQFYVYYG